MEQTVNLFTKGLQMDTNPMIQGSDTLTDALNATLVTMNGNEVILQNDMGNRRVDNAFLPPGYEPVGMKEYGGVIYVASYNPVTHRSQIGSFPSPERRISYTDSKSGTNGNNYNFDFPSDRNNSLVELCLKSDVLLNPIDNDLILHAGDKFVIYSGNLDSIKSYLSNCNNTINNKIISPKNKKYTLSLGILNSLNEFVDITKDLVRWDSNSKIITEFENDSDLFKFNCGYFIAKSYSPPENYENTISDNKLILDRLAIPANTYSYKLCGPLYLKMLLNRPVKFNYNIYGYKETSISGSHPIKTAFIIIDCFITYNCPDGVENGSDLNDDIYKYDGIDLGSTYNEFCDIKEGSSILSPAVETISVVYDKKTNLYTINLRYTILKSLDLSTSNIVNYKLLIKSGITKSENSTPSDVYLLDLSTQVSVNLDLLGSGTVNLTGWRFYNNLEKLNTVLTYTFEAYPKYGQHFTNLLLKFYKYNGTSFETSPSVILNNLDLNNGRNTISFDWEEKGFEKRKLYKVEYTYLIEDNNGDLIVINYTQTEADAYNAQLTEAISTSTILTEEQVNILNRILNNNTYSVGLSPSDSDAKLYNAKLEGSISTDTIKEDHYTNDSSDIKLFLTTELFNEHYSSLANDFWPDFFESKRTFEIHVGINSNLKDNSPLDEVSYDGLLSGTSLIISYDCKHTKTLSIFDNSTYKIINEELYPDFIKLKPGIYPKIKEAFVKKIGNTILDNNSDQNGVFNSYIKPLITKNGTIDNNHNLENYNFSNFDIQHSEKYINGKIEYYDRFISFGKIVDTIKNGFCPISKVANYIFDVPNNGGGCGLSVDYHAQSGHGDDHFINLFSGVTTDTPEGDNYNFFRHSSQHSGTTPNNATTIDLLHGDSQRIFYLVNYITKASNSFSHSLPSYLTITYMYGDNAECYTDSLDVSDHYNNRNSPRTRTAARVWWRTRNNGWALFQDLFSSTSNSKTYIERRYNTTADYSIDGNNIIITLDFTGFTDYNITNASGITITYRNKMMTGSYYNHEFSNFDIDFTTNPLKLVITMNNFPRENNSVQSLFKDFIIKIEKNRIVFKKGSNKVNNLSSGKLTITSLTVGQGITLLDGDFKFHEEIENNLLTTILLFILNHLEHDYIYCAYDLYQYDSNNPALYKSDLLNSTYNEKYIIPITIGVQYEKETSDLNEPPTVDPNSKPFIYLGELVILFNPLLSSENDLLNGNESGNNESSSNNESNSELQNRTVSSPNFITHNYNIDSLIEFNELDNTNNISSAVLIILSSDNKFYDRIYLDIQLLNVDISTGKQYDFNENTLDPNYLYYYNENGELIKQNSSYLKVDRENKVDSINLLLYDREALGMGKPRYNATGWQHGDTSDASTLLDFSGINVINTI